MAREYKIALNSSGEERKKLKDRAIHFMANSAKIINEREQVILRLQRFGVREKRDVKIVLMRMRAESRKELKVA